MTLETVSAAPASRIAHRHADGSRTPDGRRIPVVILEPDVFRAFGECVTRGWSELPGLNTGDATVSGPIADAIAGAIRAHREPRGADTVWVADTRGRTLAMSVYPFNGSVRVSG